MGNTDIVIEGSTATWRMKNIEGELGGTYNGTFQFRCFLSPTQQLQAGRKYREYLGQHSVLASETEANLSFALSQLEQRIIKAPPFWTSTVQDSGIAGDIGDLSVIAQVLDASIRSENLYKEKIAKEREAILNRTIKVGEDMLQKKAEEENKGE